MISIDDTLAKLNKLRQGIGAEIVEFTPFVPADGTENAISKSGTLTLSYNQLQGVLRIHNHLLFVGNTQVTIHIYEPNKPGDHDTWTYSDPKFHVGDCDTIKNMHRSGRFKRYVSTANKNRVFVIRPYDRKKHKSEARQETRLDPCRNCLKALDYKGYNSASIQRKNEIVDEFDLNEFFAQYASSFSEKPVYTDDTMPTGGYTSDWPEVRKRYIQKVGGRCECCGVNLSRLSSMLHVHHIDGVRGNNRDSNLMAACALCHQKQPMHESMRVRYVDERSIRETRRAQGITDPCPRCGG